MSQVLLKYVKEKKHTVLLDAEDQYGNTALHIAAGDGKTEIVDVSLFMQSMMMNDIIRM